MTAVVLAAFVLCGGTVHAGPKWLHKLLGHDECAPPEPGHFEDIHLCFGNDAEIAPGVDDCDTPLCRMHRAGWPNCVAPWAKPGLEPEEWGYYVGGGAPFGGEPRYVRCEGTWGWDYAPWYSRVRLKWWHGRKYQDGEGQYKPNEKVRTFGLNERPSS
ncbi:MAG: hypothetical protein KY476_04785 [Planctomycetes bacterium]|nr:hypothetical protein [Planctomycetota bacterium]